MPAIVHLRTGMGTGTCAIAVRIGRCDHIRMHREEWVERYTKRLWEHHPQNDLMWDMNHLAPWIEDDQIESLMTDCPNDPERAAGVIFDQVIDEMEMRGEVYTPPEELPEKTPFWKRWLAKLLPARPARKA